MGSHFIHCPKIKIEHVIGVVTDNIVSSSKGTTVEKTAIEDVEYKMDELPDSDFSNSAARVFDEIDNGKTDNLP